MIQPIARALWRALNVIPPDADGYPRGAGVRAFGMATTALPALGAFVWVIYDILQPILRTTA